MNVSLTTSQEVISFTNNYALPSGIIASSTETTIAYIIAVYRVKLKTLLSLIIHSTIDWNVKKTLVPPKFQFQMYCLK